MLPWTTMYWIASAAARTKKCSTTRRRPRSQPICASPAMSWRPRPLRSWQCRPVRRRITIMSTSTRRAWSTGSTRPAVELPRPSWACPPTRPARPRWTTTRRTSCRIPRTRSRFLHRLCLCPRPCRFHRHPPLITNICNSNSSNMR